MEMMAELQRIVAEVLQMRREDVDSDLQRHDVASWDSLGHLRIIAELEEQLQISIPIEDFGQIQRVGDFEKYLR